MNVLDFLIVNGREYRNGLMIIDEKIISEIVYILNSGSEFFLIMHAYDVIAFNHLLNSFEIRKSTKNAYKCLNINQLLLPNSFERKFAQNSIFIIAETLEIYNALH